MRVPQYLGSGSSLHIATKRASGRKEWRPKPRDAIAEPRPSPLLSAPPGPGRSNRERGRAVCARPRLSRCGIASSPQPGRERTPSRASTYHAPARVRGFGQKTIRRCCSDPSRAFPPHRPCPCPLGDSPDPHIQNAPKPRRAHSPRRRPSRTHRRPMIEQLLAIIRTRSSRASASRSSW